MRRAHQGMLFVAGLLGIFAGVPRCLAVLRSIDAVDRVASAAEARGIDPTALYYTEEPIAARAELEIREARRRAHAATWSR